MSFIRIITSAFVLATLVACGSPDSAGGSGSADAAATTKALPMTIEGTLDITNDVGYDEVNDVASMTFGGITAGSEEYGVQIEGSVYSAAGQPDAGARVRATLSEVTEYSGYPMYTVSKLETL